MNDIISVIIPVYNSEFYLKECLESVCNNTYKELEIILVDDGSMDSSGDICDEYAKYDKRVKVFHRKNVGVSAARNFGISQVKGKYIAFIDSDDYVDKNYFEELVKDMIREQCELAVCNIISIVETDLPFRRVEDIVIDFNSKDKKIGKNFYLLNSSYLLYGPCNKLYIAEYILNRQLRFPEDTSYGEDLLFNFSYLQYCNTVSFKNKTAYYYHCDNAGSLSHMYRENLFENGLRLNSCIRKFCEQRDMFTEEMREYWAKRVFDDAYNSLFGLENKECKLKPEEKMKRVKKIMTHPILREAIQYADVSEYSKIYVNLIRHKMSLVFLFWRYIVRRL